MPKYEEIYRYESKSAHSKKYRYFTKEERDKADAFFEQNAESFPDPETHAQKVGAHKLVLVDPDKLVALSAKFGPVVPVEEVEIRPTEAEIRRAERRHGFTKRQRKVIRLLARGMSEEQVCVKLGLTQADVRKEFTRILERKNAASRPVGREESSEDGVQVSERARAGRSAGMVRRSSAIPPKPCRPCSHRAFGSPGQKARATC